MTDGDYFVATQVRHVAVVVVTIVLLGAIGLILLGNLAALDDVSLVYAVALVGTVGATANNYRKLQKLRHLTEADVAVPKALAIGQIYLSPLIGAVLALVLYGLFLSGVLQGEFFPTFDCSGDLFVSYAEFAECNPSTNADVAMAMLWGFIAGFAENFVPNILDSLVAEAEDAGGDGEPQEPTPDSQGA